MLSLREVRFSYSRYGLLLVPPHEGCVTAADLVPRWRAHAADLRRYGAAPVATTLEEAAVELEAALRAEADELLTLAQAATASGYSRDQLRRLVRNGTLPDFGRKYAPRFRRADLPLKAGTLITSPLSGKLVSARRQTVRASIRSD